MNTELHSPGDLGQIVREVRRKQGLSQMELSAYLGVSQRWLSELETGRGKHFDERYFRILQMLGIQLTAHTTGFPQEGLAQIRDMLQVPAE